MNEHPDDPSKLRGPTRTRGRHLTQRACALTVGAAIVFGLVACGDDEAPETAFCDAGDSLGANISGLADVDLITDGTSALDEQFAAIEDDVDQLRDSGSEVAADEIDALETATDDLGSALDDLGDDISVEGAESVANAAATVVTSANSVLDTLATTCP